MRNNADVLLGGQGYPALATVSTNDVTVDLGPGAWREASVLASC